MIQVMVKRARSQFWVISTYVLVTGMVLPLLAAITALGMLVALRIDGQSALILSLVSQAAGYIGGAYLTLFILRRSTIVANPGRCARPAVGLFIILELFTVAARLVTDKSSSVLSAASIIALYVLIALLVTRITLKKFADWQAALHSSSTPSL